VTSQPLFRLTGEIRVLVTVVLVLSILPEIRQQQRSDLLTAHV